MKAGATSFLGLGVVFFVIGLTTSRTVFTVLGIVFMSVGFAAPRKKPDPPQD